LTFLEPKIAINNKFIVTYEIFANRYPQRSSMYNAANAILDTQTTISFYYSNKYTYNKYKIVQYS